MLVPLPVLDESTHELKERAFSDRVRAAILERDHQQCQSCGTGGENRLHLHHVELRSQGGAGTEENGVTLCSDCHRDVHEGWLTLALIEWRPGRWSWFCQRKRPPKRWQRVRT